MSDNALVRLFIAIDLPVELKQKLALFARGVPGARWIAPEQIHLTLRFLGEVNQATFLAVRSSLKQVRFPGFSLSLRGVGHFPPGKYARVLWVGTEHSEPLRLMQSAVEVAVIDAGVQPEGRGFSPHITLARLHDTPPAAVASFEQAHRDFATPPFAVTEFTLYSSLLTRNGAIHHKESSYPSQ